MLPRRTAPSPEVVLVNTSGGVTGGDRIDWRLDGRRRVRRSSPRRQAAERVYRSSGRRGPDRDPARGRRRRAALDWLPQETILFDGGRLDRAARGRDGRGRPASSRSRCVVLGRAAMGERVATGAPLRPVAHPPRRAARPRRGAAAEGDLGRAAAGPATLRGGRAFATLVQVAPGAEARLDAARALLDGSRASLAAASAKPGVLIVRLLAADARPLRAGVIRFLMAFRTAPLPRVWNS